MVVSFCAGFLYERFGYKSLCLFGLCISMVGGVYPYFMPGLTDYTFIIISRAIVGFGLGFSNPVGAALVMRMYDGQNRTKLLAIGMAVFNLSGVIFQTLGGVLAEISWNTTFLGYLFMVIPIVIIAICLKDPILLERPEGAELKQKIADESNKGGNKSKIPARIWLLMGAFFFCQMCVLTIVFMFSGVLEENGLGGPSMAALCGNSYTIAGIIGGIIFASVIKVFKKFTGPVYFGLMVVALAVCFFAISIPGQMIGGFLAGIGHIGIMTYVQDRIGALVSPDRIGWCNGFLQAIMQFGSFMSSFWIGQSMVLFAQYGASASRLVSLITYIILFIVMLIIMLKTKDWSASSSSEKPDLESAV